MLALALVSLSLGNLYDIYRLHQLAREAEDIVSQGERLSQRAVSAFNNLPRCRP